jgi:hypothetical protein
MQFAVDSGPFLMSDLVKTARLRGTFVLQGQTSKSESNFDRRNNLLEVRSCGESLYAALTFMIGSSKHFDILERELGSSRNGRLLKSEF